LLNFDRADIRAGLTLVKELPRIGDKAASGFLGVLFKHDFAAVDRWVVLLLQRLGATDFPEQRVSIWNMNPDDLSTVDVVQIIEIFRCKARELNVRRPAKINLSPAKEST